MNCPVVRVRGSAARRSRPPRSCNARRAPRHSSKRAHRKSPRQSPSGSQIPPIVVSRLFSDSCHSYRNSFRYRPSPQGAGPRLRISAPSGPAASPERPRTEAEPPPLPRPAMPRTARPEYRPPVLPQVRRSDRQVVRPPVAAPPPPRRTARKSARSMRSILSCAAAR